MKKRVLSLFLAFVLSFSMMPMSAFAEETGTVTEQQTQKSEDSAEVSTTGEDISSGNAVTKDAEVEAAQALINALPEEVTAENAEKLQAQLIAIDEALAALTEEQAAKLDRTRLENIQAALNGAVAVQDDGNNQHNHDEEWIEWTDGNNLPNDSGKYYLSKSVTLTDSWKPVNGIVLCLNNYSITMNANTDEVIKINDGVTFTLCSCKRGSVTHGEGYNGRGVTVNGGKFIMSGGFIRNNNTSQNGGGVYVDGGTFEMTGGNEEIEGLYVGSLIQGNTAKYNGGGVYVNSGTFTMTGNSTVNSNKADENGGGVYVNSVRGTFNMTGGSIPFNTANYGYGGGVYMNNGTFNMTDGEVYYNSAKYNGGGVYVNPEAVVTVAGNVKINQENKDTDGESNNVYLDTIDGTSATITVTGKLDDDANIGVTTKSKPTEENPVTFATAGTDYDLTAADAAHFSSDENYYPLLMDNEVKLYRTKPHMHFICGADSTCNHTGTQHSDTLIWKGISDLNEITENGNYYLKENVTLKSAWWCNFDVKLCLNGKTITGASGYDVIGVGSGSLDITDCNDEVGQITHASNTNGCGIEVDGTLTLWNGNITGNTSDGSNAGGVSVNNSGSFTMNGGAITQNENEGVGGGVEVVSGGTFTMNGGEITGNTSTSHGGGVYAAGSFNMNGGTITGNNTTIKSTDICSGGVYVNTGSNFTVSGAAKIIDNWKNGQPSDGKYVQGTDGTAGNVYLSNDVTFTVGDNGLTKDAQIGVSISKAKLPTVEKNVPIATNAKDGQLDYNKIFPLDVNDSNYTVIRDNNGNLAIYHHQHRWIYTVSDDATITVKCEIESCPTNAAGSVTIAAPEESTLTYDGKAKEATLNNSLPDDVTVPTIIYKDKDGTESSTVPTDAGEYTASITLGDATASVTYEIEKAAPTANDFTLTVSRATYNGEAKEATVVSNKEGMGTVTVKYYQGDEVVENPTDAGTYTVKISVEEGENYKAASELGSDEWKFIIEGNKNAPIVKLNDDTYTYTGAQIQPAVTVTVGGKELVKDRDYTVDYGKNINAGDGTVIITAKGNYAFDKVTKYFTIEQAEQTLSFEESNVTKTFIDKPFSNKLTHQVGDGAVTYASSDITVAKVDKTTGEVTIQGVGTATITATAAATTNYEEGSASYTLTVKQTDIYFSPMVKAKDYDGTKDADFTVSFYYYDENKDRVELPLTEDTDYNVTGAFNNENAWPLRRVTVKVTLTEDCAKKYNLIEDTYEVNSKISPRTISIEAVKADSRSYEKDNTSVTISDVTFNNAIPGTLTEGEDYTVTGVMDDANAGTNKEVTVKVTLSGDAATNYIFEDDKNTTTTTVEISKATPVITAATWKTLMNNGIAVDISDWATFNNTDSDAKLTYEWSDVNAVPQGITLDGNMLKAETTVKPIEENNFAIKVTAKATKNFKEPDVKYITVQVVNKITVGVEVKGVPDTVTYGDPDFSLTAGFDSNGTVPAEGDNGTWNWSSNDNNNNILEIQPSADGKTAKIHVKNAGTVMLTVTYTSATYSGVANISITVNSKTITKDMIGNIDAQEYTGKDIKPTPEVKDGTTKLTNGTDFTYSYSSNRDAGTARLTITGEGNYTGTAYKDFDISKKSIDGATIVLDDKSLSYTGSEQTVSITSVKLSDGTVLSADDYVIKDNSNKATDAGEIALTIEGKGNYTGTATTTWEITRIDPKRGDFVVTSEDLTTALTYDGTAKTVTVTTADDIKGMGEITVKYNGSTEAPTNAGSYEVTFEVADGTNYNAQTFDIGTLTINKAAAPERNDIEAGYKYTLTGEKTVKLADLVADATGYTLGNIAGDTDIISDYSVDANGALKFTLTGKGVIGDRVTLPVTITSVNYEDTTVKVVITLKAKDDQTALSITGDTTVVYGKTLTLGTTGGSGTGKVTYSIDEANSTGEATIDTNGVLTPTKVGKVTIIATKAGDADYNEATSAAFVITITKASSTGEPKYTVITADGKTLADAGLTLTDSTLTPAEGTLKWVDEAGNELSADTKVEVNKTYKWLFTPANDNYDTLTGEVELWHVDAPAVSAQPKSVSVTAGEKAAFEVTATGTDVTYQWQIDRNDGKGFVDINGATGATYTTGVTDKSCDGFKYQCVISNAAGSVTTDTVVLAVKEKYIITASAGEHGSISPGGAVEVVEGSNQTFVIAAEEGYEIESLTVDGTAVNVAASYTFENVTAAHTIAVTFKQQYKIIDGANSSWTQNTDGSGSIKIRGSGGFSKFRNVMVDGNVIDPLNYTAREGSTIIELHEDYLKTLSEGIHTLAIVWTDGTASTNFTVAKNTPDDDDDNDDNGGSNNNTNTAGSSDNTAQTLTKSPKTGDASGLWIALFAASAAGLAVMLVVRRKKY